MVAQRFVSCFVLALVTLIVGCAGYRFGNRSLYRNDIRTIHVPVVRSDSFRPELGVLMTEAIQKEIERRTPYKLSEFATSDSVLNCRITADSKRVTAETPTDESRLLQSVMSVEVQWVDRRNVPLIETRFLPNGETTFYFADNENFVPEAGQSIATANQRLAERLANHIVDQMETRW
ncbi:MAG: LPS assembly lipoprotein LptE [Pirellula sp.]|jgi:hypothetical protein